MKLEIEFDEGEMKAFEEVIELYHLSKELMIYSEEIGGRRFTPVIEEFTHAFDHLMRVFAFKLGFKPTNADYALKNLERALGHLYRADYDLVDWLSILFKEKVRDELKSFSARTVQEIFPKYYQEIKPYFEIEAPKEISKLRDIRDIAKPSKSNLNEFVEIFGRLKSYYEEILEIKPSLVEYEKKERQEKRKSRLWQILIPFIATVIGILIGIFLSVS